MSEGKVKLEKHELDHELRLTMEKAGRMIASLLSQVIDDSGCKGRVGFCLMMAEYGEGGWSSYIANIQREDMHKLLEEFLEQSRKGGEKEIVGKGH